MLQKFFFLLKLNFLLFVWHSAHIVGALQVQVVICSIQVRNLHKMYFAASCEMQFDDVELYVLFFFFFNLGKREAADFFFFCKLTLEKLIQVESPYNQTPLNYANPHAQLIVCSPPSPLPTPLVFSNENTAKHKGSSGEMLRLVLILIFWKTCSFFWVLMRNGRNGISFCTF